MRGERRETEGREREREEGRDGGCRGRRGKRGRGCESEARRQTNPPLLPQNGLKIVRHSFRFVFAYVVLRLTLITLTKTDLSECVHFMKMVSDLMAFTLLSS